MLQESTINRVASRYLNERTGGVSANPFQGLSYELSEALRVFAVDLAFWMGNVNVFHLKRLHTSWKQSKELQAWLSRNVNLPSYDLYYGRKLSPSETSPEVGGTWKRKEKVQQWTTRMGTARWFAGLPASDSRPGGVVTQGTRGMLVEATARRNQVIVDVDRFSRLCGHHRDGFLSVMSSGDSGSGAAGILSGEEYEGEVITLPLLGRISEVS